MNQIGGIVRVGVIGLGRSGWSIHCDAFQRMPDLYKVVALHDPLPDRLAESANELDATAHTTLEDILNDPNVDLLVIASPNKFHFEQALAGLNAGKHVLCDKPFGTTVAEVDQLIAAAKAAGKVIQPFQQRRYEPDFRKLLEVRDSGVLGTLQLIRICWHGFKRRWDWQTIPEMKAGELYNNGPHPIDHAMLILGDSDEQPLSPEVWCERRHCLASGQGEDHVKIILRAPGKPTVEIEISSTIAFGQDRWLVCGTAGGLRGTANELKWKYVDWTTMPPRPLDPTSTPDRSYNSETLNWHQEKWSPAGPTDAGAGAAPASGPTVALYTDLHATLTQGRPQVITPQSVRRRVAILEQCVKIAPVIR